MSELRITAATVGHPGGGDVVHELDLHVPSGGVDAVLGASGSGKSTLLLAIAGLLPLRAGEIAVGDRVLSTARRTVPPERRGVGWVPQDASLFPHLTVAENIAFGLPRSERDPRGERVRAMLELVELGGFGDRSPADLSGGQAQRVALARALAPAPSIVLLDEPFSALDATLRVGLRREIGRILRDAGATALLVTHDQEEAFALADRVSVLRSGRVEQHGTAEELFARPRSAWLATFLGESTLVPARRDGDAWRTPLGPVPVAAGAIDDAEALLVVRPEQLKPFAAGVPITVRDVEYSGHDRLLLAEAEGVPGTVLMRMPSAIGIELGTRMPVRIHGTPHAVPLAGA
ncbi:ABC transporter ATP-binding protein [Agrococcus sp. BE272]|uniref:ABC transporter ATP-binding protein n=1 Tax=Agrococcus sp. BE272 TaxID=2817727 RepID=UPI00285DB269|nr:ABC transporter ATP-binding protein [Agrococcus sp. BE272]MDR7234112.1 iron(III) transport system ATP-binding protein [Agrococcus sp. BE272]